MEAGLHCCYSNSHQRYGTLMDSPPPPYYGGCGDGGSSSSGSEDFSFEGTMFSVLGSGRKYIPCPHCRLEVGAFETLLLKSDGLRKGNNRCESIFLVNVLERYNVIGNGDSLDGRPPLYTIPNSSHFGAEYCRHCNEANSVSNKPPSCDSTRAETSSPASSDVEQLSTSLEDNSLLTNRYSEKSDQPSDNKSFEGNDSFFQSNHTGKNVKYKHRTSNGYCQRKSAKILDETTENHRNNTNNHICYSQSRYIPNHVCHSPEYSNPWLCKSYHKVKHANNNTRFNSNVSCHRNSFARYQDESLLGEGVGELLQNKMDSKFEEVLKCGEDELYSRERLEEEIESLKATIANLIEETLKYWVPSYGSKRKLSSTEHRISYSKADTPPPMKLNCKKNDSSQISLTETISLQNSSTPIQTNSHSKESRVHPLNSTDTKTYCPHLQKINLKNDRRSQQYQYQDHQEIPSPTEDEQTVQTPGNDSGFFSPSPRILQSPSAWQQRKHESDSKSFRYNSHNISSEYGFKYPKPETDKSDDSDQYETELNPRNRKRTKVGNIHQSYSTETRNTSSKVKVNDDDYDQSDQVISPRENNNSKIKSPKKGKFRRSTDQNENQKSDPDLQSYAHERKFRQMNGDISPARSVSLKKTSNSLEEVEKPVIEHQNRSQINASPISSRVAPMSPESEMTEWEIDIKEQLSTADNLNTSLSETSEATDISNTDDSYGTLSSVAKRFDFDIYSDQATSSVDLDEGNSTKEWQANTDRYVTSEISSSPLPERPTRDKATLVSNKAGKILKGALKLDNDSKSKRNRHVEIKEESSAENSQVQIGMAPKESPPKLPSIETVKRNKKRDTSVGTFVEGELDYLHTTHKKGTLYAGGPFQADQHFRSWLADIKCNDNGQYIVSDWSNCCVQMFSTVGLPGDRVTFKSGPWSLALMDANVVACTIPNARQLAFLSHGARLVVVGLVSTEQCYWGIAVTRDQNLVCSCILGIDLLSNTGQPLRTLQYNKVGLDFFIFPQYITIGDNDVIYVSDSCGTYLLGIPKEGEINFEFRPIQSNKFITPRDIEYSPDGYIYIADTETNKIYRLTKDGKLDCELFTAKDGIKGPLAITLRQNTIIMTQKDSSILVLPL
ncbi:uncharacterized protein LOC106876217 [Octopus bimaculoides]|uniref:Uncharacterized protein n=1 Tax=Octopus bimaculoides TaxID=37653 RepID=A0A0L8GKK5_OCTBM|nr:uncharacterized protein LOC106876217 [Octopus bimaculoides]XP_014780178.1 uncharacterized protein LOC106876217 [Octopus bimaculoides]XP_052823734.1 uncharacterized protein LOC106876217 [Octopus bimaculoides]XP_052823735.1 uncharacterized protein LOC106876217 [Octopus bimaculoides]|eukprot:XP_014780177.1 PREDICTED: uncharacterized protein LOC106876217 [Octopus bimaculoides]